MVTELGYFVWAGGLLGLISESWPFRTIINSASSGLGRLTLRILASNNEHEWLQLRGKHRPRDVQLCKLPKPRAALGPGQSYVDFSFNIRPFLRCPESNDKVFERATILRCIFEPGQKIEWFCQFTTVMKPPRNFGAGIRGQPQYGEIAPRKWHDAHPEQVYMRIPRITLDMMAAVIAPAQKKNLEPAGKALGLSPSAVHKRIKAANQVFEPGFS